MLKQKIDMDIQYNRLQVFEDVTGELPYIARKRPHRQPFPLESTQDGEQGYWLNSYYWKAIFGNYNNTKHCLKCKVNRCRFIFLPAKVTAEPDFNMDAFAAMAQSVRVATQFEIKLVRTFGFEVDGELHYLSSKANISCAHGNANAWDDKKAIECIMCNMHLPHRVVVSKVGLEMDIEYELATQLVESVASNTVSVPRHLAIVSTDLLEDVDAE